MYLSDLRGGGPVRFRRAMIAAVNRLTPEDAELREWNDALEYLADAPKERTAHAARIILLNGCHLDVIDALRDVLAWLRGYRALAGEKKAKPSADAASAA